MPCLTRQSDAFPFVRLPELFYDRGHHHEFLSLSQELAAPGDMRQAQTFDFHFKNVEKQYESYQGINVKLRCARLSLSLWRDWCGAEVVLIYVRARYFVRLTISRRLADVSKEKDLWVHSYRMPPDSNNSIKMEVGIEDCLHIEFEYNKSKFVPYVLMRWRVWCVHACAVQVPLEGRDRGQDLLFACENQDQTHGALYHSSRDNGCRPESVQRERDDYKV